MGQDYFPSQGESSRRAATQPKVPDEASQGHPHDRPNYMTVGTGSISESAKSLQAWLDSDSGYAGSLTAESYAQEWAQRLAEDRPTPPPVDGDQRDSEGERRMRASHVHQLYYNHNRTALARAITKLLDTLKGLQDTNHQWPLHYPSPQRPVTEERHKARPGLHHTQTLPAISNDKDRIDLLKGRPPGLKRAESEAPEDTRSEGEQSTRSGDEDKTNEPRLVTAQLAREFSVLKIDLQMDRLSQAEIISSLNRDSKALAGLVDGQINKSKRHLLALRERIEDTSSKVLITGDLNAGKSAFCNALLRRKVLPEDEQPCTSIFCEVLDVRKNRGVEEVHAIPHGVTYNHDDETTYIVFALANLEDVVVDSERFSQCKVYVRDIRTVDESLLNNGVLDIALIDAPGLNSDSLQTTAVFARQEEIDVVVFVVSAANHFTLSAQEFILDAAREKSYMFMVVNGFDMIKDQRRCKERIFRQVRNMTPDTFKESAELVHFVSSNAVPVAPLNGEGGPASSSTGSGGFGSPGDPDNNNPGDDDDEDNDGEATAKHGESNVPSNKSKGKGKEREKMRDFDQLEASLRQFVLEKRARSKLAPAKTYLTHVLDDLDNLAHINQDIAQSELDRVAKELAEIEPLLEQSRNARMKASDDAYQSTEDTAQEVYSHTRDTINNTISDVSERELGVEYPGFLGAYRYAEDITAAMLKEISEVVDVCENYARRKTSEGVNAIKSIGLLHLGDAYVDLNFHADKMLKRRKDALARQVDIDVEIWDFFDLASLWERQEKFTGSTMAVTVAGMLGGRLLGGAGWVDGVLGAAKIMGPNNLRRMMVPGLVLSAALILSYVIASIPQSLPRRLSAKLAAQLASIDFTHVNALRISSEVRRALKIPSENLRVGLQRQVEELQRKREDTSKIKVESEVARKYFSNLIRDTSEILQNVRRVDLDGTPPGMAGLA